jgi:ferric-dicitrate binding protein FerR (iron transport regulator)
MVNEELIIKCIAGEADQHELTMLENWRAIEPKNEQFYQQIFTIWNRSALLENLPKVNVDDAWNKLQDNIQKPKGKIVYFNKIWMAAASVVLLIGIGIFLFRTNEQTSELLSLKVNKSKQNITLNDGSIVTVLNGELNYPKQFNGKIRRVELKNGTAYFDIHKDSTHPFEIQCNKTNITVLGTEFEVKRDKDHIRVIVNEGKVRFSTPAGLSLLTKGMSADYNESSNSLNTNTSFQSNETAYATGILDFNNASLKSVAHQLELYNPSYKIEIPTSVENCKITSKFNLKEGVENVVKILSATVGSELEISSDKKHFILKGGQCTL